MEFKKLIKYIEENKEEHFNEINVEQERVKEHI